MYVCMYTYVCIYVCMYIHICWGWRLLTLLLSLRVCVCLSTSVSVSVLYPTLQNSGRAFHLRYPLYVFLCPAAVTMAGCPRVSEDMCVRMCVCVFDADFF